MSDLVGAQLRIGRVVLGAMIVGVLVFAAVALLIGPKLDRQTDPTIQAILLLALGALLVIELPVYLAIRAAALNRLRRTMHDGPLSEDDVRRLVQQMHILTLVPAAMLEAWGLFGGVVHLLTGVWAALITPAVAVLGLGLLMPTRDSFARFVTDVTGQLYP